MLSHREESALLKAYIAEWTKYFTQCEYLPKPFQAMEMEATKPPKKKSQEGNKVQLVSAFCLIGLSSHHCMLQTQSQILKADVEQLEL